MRFLILCRWLYPLYGFDINFLKLHSYGFHSHLQIQQELQISIHQTTSNTQHLTKPLSAPPFSSRRWISPLKPASYVLVYPRNPNITTIFHIFHYNKLHTRFLVPTCSCFVNMADKEAWAGQGEERVTVGLALNVKLIHRIQLLPRNLSILECTSGRVRDNWPCR